MKYPFAAVVCLIAGASLCQAADGDPGKGAQIYQRCLACHSLEHNRSGPRHCGLFGRPAAALPDFSYSQALKSSALVWDEASLDRFLENPLKAVPGTKMAYAGVKNSQERADLIAYLKSATRDAEKCPSGSSP
jgi:cytochrome c